MWWKLHVKPQNLKVLAKNEGITQKNLEILIKPPQWKKTRRLQNLAKLMLKDLGKCWTNLRKVTQPQLQIHLGLTFRSNNGKDYFNQELTSYLEHEGILHHSSCVSNPHPPGQVENWVVERKNRHLLEVAWALLFQMKVSPVLITTYLINRLQTKVLEFQTQ